MIGSDLMFLRVRITFCGRLFGKITNAIRPFLFGADALFGERFNSVAQESAAILFHCLFDRALVVVNKKPAEIDKLDAILEFKKFERADKRVSGAGANVSLVFYRRTLLSQINFCWQSSEPRSNCAVGEVAMIRQVRQPSVPFGRSFVYS